MAYKIDAGGIKIKNYNSIKNKRSVANKIIAFLLFVAGITISNEYGWVSGIFYFFALAVFGACVFLFREMQVNHIHERSS